METAIVNYLLTRSDSSSGIGDQTDSTKYLLSSLAFTLICWWKIGKWTKPDPTGNTENPADFVPV